MKTKYLLRGFALTCLVSGGFFAGFAAPTLRASPQNPAAAWWQLQTTPAALWSALSPSFAHASGDDIKPDQVYNQVLGAVRSYYIPGATGDTQKTDVSRLTYAAARGMLESVGDRYTEFYTPKDYRAMLAEQSGSFVGIGATLDQGQKRVVISRPIAGSPAERAGLRPGDEIIAVDGTSVAGMSVDAVIDRIRGDENTLVRLSVARNHKVFRYVLRRELVQSPVVESRMVDEANKVGYISLSMFSEQADKEFDAALAGLEKRGMRALIFDLRDNPGGLLDVAQDVASRFLPSGPVVWVKEKSGSMSSLDVHRNKHRGSLSSGAYPVAVLVNGYSASASEIVAGAIQDGKAGVIVGERTYGKGLVQTIIPLPGDSAVKITTQHYFTRGKHDINIHRDMAGKAANKTGGIHPDVPVEITDRQIQAIRSITGDNPLSRATQDKLDPQLQRAVSVVRERLVVK